MRASLVFILSLIVNAAVAQKCIVEISSGGGITGVATVYRIDEHGKVLKGTGLGQINFNQESQLKKSIAKKYYRQAVKSLGTTDFIHPGNLYYSLAAIENGKETRMTWGDAQFVVPDPPTKVYEEIRRALSSLKFSPNPKK